MHPLTRALVVVGAAGLAPSCAEPSAPVTYARVQPLLAASCVQCHDGTDANRGRPALHTYESAREHAQAALLLAESGLMPPSGIDRECGDVVGPRALDEHGLATLRAWIEHGMPRGDTRNAGETSADPSGADGGGGGDVVNVRYPLSSSADDEQRCLVVDVESAAFLTGVRVRDARSVHHVMIFSGGAADEREGVWPCPGLPSSSAQLAFAWVPGRAASEFPDGHGVPLSGARVIVQVHENGAGDGDVDIELLVSDDAAPLDIVTLAAAGFALPPGDSDVVIERLVASPVGGRVVASMPHMHRIGAAVSLTHADGCVVDVPRWVYAFQELAIYREPLPLPAGAPMTLSCAWDTSTRTAPTPWGESSDDEMCTVFLFVARD